MSNLYNIASYKNKIINLLLKNEAFVKLINPEPSECKDLDIYDVLLGGEWIINGVRHEEQGHIFDHNFVDDTTTDEKTFVFVETNIEYIRNDMFADFSLFICIFTSRNLVRLTDITAPTTAEVKKMGYFSGENGNRIDVLCDIIDRTINGNTKIPGIGVVQPDSRAYVTQYCPNNKYYGKCLKYNITNYIDNGDEICENQ